MLAAPLEDRLLELLRSDCASVDATALRTLTRSDWESLLGSARALGVAPFLCSRSKVIGLEGIAPAPFIAALKQDYLLAAARGLRLSVELGDVLDALHGAGIIAVVLKGAFLSETVYPHRGCRPMLDIDLLVPREHLLRAAEAMAGAGYRSRLPGDLAAWAAREKELPDFVKPRAAFPVDLHWTLSNLSETRGVDDAGLLQRAVTATLAGRRALALAPEDLLLHLCRHVAIDHRFEYGLMPFVDIAATVTYFSERLDWDAIVQRAACWRWSSGIYLALRVAQDWLGAGVPRAAMAALRPDQEEAEVLQIVRHRALGGSSTEGTASASPSLLRLWEARGLVAKLALLRDRLFDADAIAFRYGADRRSPCRFFHYLRRCWDLLRRHGPYTLSHLAAPARMDRWSRSEARLDSWLGAEPASAPTRGRTAP